MSPSANNAPSEALMQLLAPDGYYKYLGISKNSNVASTDGGGGDKAVDLDLVKKNYRKLSLKHHPDKPGGDAETFRVLNRAQKVLSHPKLRQQYDILGMDLDDDEHEHDTAAGSTDEGSGDENASSTSQGIVHEIASMALTSVLQLGVKTVMMGTVSLLIVRYIWTLLIALAFLSFVAFRIYSLASTSGANGTSTADMLSPFMIGTGLILMYQSPNSFWLFWLGESFVIGMFTINSLNMVTMYNHAAVIYISIGIFSLLAALWFRGKFWNYAIVVGLELFLAIFIAVAFPIMEMVLEAILNDKLKKVGDKLRHQHQQMEKYYSTQQHRR